VIAGMPGPTITIVALGDSTTAGTPAFRSPLEAPPDGDGDVTSAYCWWMMQAEPTWRVLNRGVNRERTEAIAARFDRDVLAAAPDVLILLAGVNDIYDGDAAADVQARLAVMYGRARDAGLPVVACSILPFDTATADQTRRMRAVNAWIHATATTTDGVAWCDTAAAAALPGRPDRLLGSPDGLHPGVDGHRRMAEALVPVVQAVLSGREPPLRATS
jgi:lysophospholipase L1-like esterase